jgi:hypothetical protein
MSASCLLHPDKRTSRHKAICGASKQIIVIQKQDCGGLSLVHLSRTRVVRGPTKNFGDFVKTHGK